MSHTKGRPKAGQSPLCKIARTAGRSRLLSAAAEHDAANIDALFQAFASNLAQRLVHSDATPSSQPKRKR
ncbi:MAG: hypothetical protein AAGC96_21945 [Pseudomonadota bacterium]